MPPRIPDDKRAAILADIKAGGKSRAQIAREHSVNPQTVGNIAKDAGAADAFSRLQTEKATRAAASDNRSRRAKLASDLLDDAELFRQRAWSKYEYYERGAEGPELVALEKPPLKEAKEAYVAIGIALDKHAMLEKHDSGVSDAASSLLDAVASSLQAAFDTTPVQPDQGGETVE